MMYDFGRHVSPTLYRIPTRVLFEELYMVKLIPHAMSSLDQYHPYYKIILILIIIIIIITI
jgi:phosphoglycerol transferase MdoB-like AlkP superfamily enzyme